MLHHLELASLLTTIGVTVQRLQAHHVFGSSPGHWIRKLLVFTGVIQGICLAILSFNFEWMPKPSLLSRDICNPASYGTNLSFDGAMLSEYMQGDVDLVTINSFALQLDDGLASGWSAWPLSKPAGSFSLKTTGVGFIISAECKDAIGASKAYDGTIPNVTSTQLMGNYMEGVMSIYYPPGSSASVLDVGKGIRQECNWKAAFGKADVEIDFEGDKWNMLSIHSIESVSFQGMSLAQGYSNTTKFANVLPSVASISTNPDDVYMLTSMFQREVLAAFNGQIYYPTRDIKYARLFSWGTRQDGLYHVEDTWKGVTMALAVAGHYLTNQYDASIVGDCDYYGFIGGGELDVNQLWIRLNVVFTAAVLVLFIGYTAYIYATIKHNALKENAWRALTSKFRMAHDMTSNSKEIFGESESVATNPHTDIAKAIGKKAIFYGFRDDSKSNSIGFGLRNQIRSLP